jgi:hypothetical protein
MRWIHFIPFLLTNGRRLGTDATTTALTIPESVSCQYLPFHHVALPA